MSTTPVPATHSVVRALGRLALAAVLLSAGAGHLTTLREEFQAQVPSWVPLDPDLVVLASGVVELTLGLGLALAPRRFRPLVGWVVAAFFVAIFPGNISQLVTHTDAFGLDSDRARAVRLVFQPVLVAWALWSTGAWRAASDARIRRLETATGRSGG
jgi:uncharacterized membrane protein